MAAIKKSEVALTLAGIVGVAWLMRETRIVQRFRGYIATHDWSNDTPNVQNSPEISGETTPADESLWDKIVRYHKELWFNIAHSPDEPNNPPALP